MKLRTLLLLSLLIGVVLPATASAVNFGLSSPGNLGLDVSFGCEAADVGTCSASRVFDLAAVADASGSLSLPGATIVAGATTADLSLSLPSASLTGSSNGVEEVIFSTSYSVVGEAVTVLDAGSSWNILGFVATSISGSYEQIQSGGASLGSTAIAAVATANLNCLVSKTTGTGQCGLTIPAADLVVPVGDPGVAVSDHAFEQTFNLAVPEPSTALLVGLGLAGLTPLLRRRR